LLRLGQVGKDAVDLVDLVDGVDLVDEPALNDAARRYTAGEAHEPGIVPFSE